jgi:transposase-like protein
MPITIEITCPRCQSPNISRNGKKSNGKQKYLCKDCGRQFISNQDITYQGCRSWVVNLIKIRFVRGIDIRHISTVLNITTVLKVLTSGTYRIKPKKAHYDCLEIDEFWTYVGEKKNNVWLICHRGKWGDSGICGGNEI